MRRKLLKVIHQDVIKQLNSISKAKPDEVIYFGDGKWDYETCEKIGIWFIGIDSKNNSKLMNCGANEVYQDFEHEEIIIQSLKSDNK